MESAELTSPVLFLVFNRPEITRRVFDAIRQARPPRLYIAADGPRNDKLGEDLKVQAVREYVTSHVDWECEVKTLFRDKNLGCKIAVSSAIDWFFENEEEGIVLEDDCLPDQSFFYFCQDLLLKYRDDTRVMMISGDNFLPGRKDQYSYYFSRYCHIWGWASWRRAWKHYDVAMNYWPSLRDGSLLLQGFSSIERIAWKRTFDSVWSGKIDTWDAQWVFAAWLQHGISVMPRVNLVSNIGFGAEAAHTKKKLFSDTLLQANVMSFPLKHPSFMLCDYCADARTQDLFRPQYLKEIVLFVLAQIRTFFGKLLIRGYLL